MAAEHEKRRPADDSEQMVIRRWGQAHWGQAPGPSPITWPCMHAGRQTRIPAGGGLEDCQRSIGKRPAPCFLVLYTVADVTLIAHGRRTPRRGLEHGHEAVQVFAAACTPYRDDRRPPGNISIRERLSRPTTLCR
jgi:hypothetical protein